MALGDGGLLPFLLFVMVTAAMRFWWAPERDDGASSLHRSSFLEGFVFGTASSSYQFEGAAREGGRGPSIWDTFTHTNPEKIADGSNGDVAVDSYHRYKDDVKIMKDMGMDAYRFSISWSRLLPNGSLSGGVNEEGVQYYNNLINELISNGLQPFITLFHWDTPQGLEDQYGGFLSEQIVLDFRDYADVCFKEFGDRVKNWITLNEPLAICETGYSRGIYAPGRCSPWEMGRCSAGDSSREPYIVAHHLLLAHAAAVELYKQKYQEEQGGKIGITLDCRWALPYSNSESDVHAAERSIDFQFGWFMDPLTQGDYPYNMRKLVGDRLPNFNQEQSKLVNGSFDFIGLNYYTSFYAYSVPLSPNANTSYTTDSYTKRTFIRNGVPIGPMAASNWLYIYPAGLRELLLYVKNKYNNPVVYITENGVDEWNNKTESLEEALNDQTRVDYYREHLLYVQRAISEGVKVKGYFAWSLFDNFEWKDGYTVRFGLNFVDFQNGLKRYPKKSALWFHKFLK